MQPAQTAEEHYYPFAPIVEYSLHLTKIFYFKIRREHQKIFHQRRAYESVDVRTLFRVIRVYGKPYSGTQRDINAIGKEDTMEIKTAT